MHERTPPSGEDLASTRAAEPVTADDVRSALFTQRRPLIKPLFEPNRPAGVAFEHPPKAPDSFLGRLIAFFSR